MNNKMKQILPIVFAAITFASTATAYNPPTGPFATRFWDCCPAAFAWSSDKVAVHSPVDMCEKDGVTPIPQKSQLSGKNGCQGGNMFACNCITPWMDTVDPELAYGYGAYNIHDPDGTIESACYLVEFLPQDPNGKTMKVRKMIVQNINTSQELPKGSWDLNLAGGGVGAWPQGCTGQWGTDWGKQYGGVDNEQSCCSLPEGLRSSCLFRFRMLGENPGLALTPKRVRCPVGIIDRSGSQRQDDASVAPYSGKTDKTGYPAPDKYQRNRSVCQNVDPIGIVTSVCGGTPGGARLPKGSGMIRQDGPGATVPDDSTGSTPAVGQPEGYGAAPDASGLTGGGKTDAGSPTGEAPTTPENGVEGDKVPTAPDEQMSSGASQPGASVSSQDNLPQDTAPHDQDRGVGAGTGISLPNFTGSQGASADGYHPENHGGRSAGHRRGVCAPAKHRR